MKKANITHQIERCIKTLNQHLEAENEHDVTAIMETYGPDPEVYINGEPFIGMEKIQFFHERFGFGNHGSFSEVRVEEKKRYLGENAIILELELQGVHTQKWQGQEPTGKKFNIPVCTVYSFDENGKLSGEDVYFDSWKLRKQLDL